MELEMLVSIIVFMALVSVTIIIGIVLYVLSSIAIGRIIKENESKHNIILAWIPVIKYIILAEMVGDVKIFERQMPSNVILLASLALLTIGTRDTGVIYVIVAMMGLVLTFILYHELYRRFPKVNSAILLTCLSMIVPFLCPIFLFIYRKEKFNNVGIMDYPSLRIYGGIGDDRYKSYEQKGEETQENHRED